MSIDVIISYDGTPNDDDALALGKRLSRGGFTLALAYVRHMREFDHKREEVAQHDADRRLERGAELLGDPDVDREVVFGASTGEGLQTLAQTLGAKMIVFGSDYRTAPGHVEPGTSAQYLLNGSPIAVAIASAGLRTTFDGEIESVAVPVAGPENDVARHTAQAMAEKLGAMVVESGSRAVDLVVVGSAPGAHAGRIAIGGDVRTELDRARSSVLVLPAGYEELQ
jgi:nucleotide-binding universal stress UspA family protein